MTLPAGMQHRIPRDSTAGIIPLYPARGIGDERQGLIRVPDELTHSKPHSEQRRQFTKLIDQNLTTWCAWLEKKGWVLNSRPKVSGPFDPPSETERVKPVDEGMKHYFATAYFTRAYPLYMPYDAAAWYRDEAWKYGEESNAPASVDSEDSHRTVKTILNPERVDPMKFAAERRERLGIRPDDWTQQPITAKGETRKQR